MNHVVCIAYVPDTETKIRIAARSTVVVAPVLDGEPMTTSVVYSPPLLVLSLFLATVAGVLAVLGVARLRHGRPVPN